MTLRTFLVMALASLAMLALLAVDRQASAQPPIPPLPSSFDGVIAGWEAYARGEAERQQAQAQQLGANDTIARYAPVPPFPFYPPAPAGIYFYPPRAYRWPMHGPIRAFRPYPGAFVPWPMPPAGPWPYPYPGLMPMPPGYAAVPDGASGYPYQPTERPDQVPQESPPAIQVPAAPTPWPGSPQPSVPSTPDKPAPETVPAPQPEIGAPR